MLNLGQFHRSGAFFVVVGNMVIRVLTSRVVSLSLNL
jgi:hypothetical protein